MATFCSQGLGGHALQMHQVGCGLGWQAGRLRRAKQLFQEVATEGSRMAGSLRTMSRDTHSVQRLQFGTEGGTGAGIFGFCQVNYGHQGPGT